MFASRLESFVGAHPLERSDLKSKAPRILVKLDEYFAANPLPQRFSHYRPARYLHEKLDVFAGKISAETKERFARAFADLNSLLK
jgi:hypothetical protein